MTAAATAKDFDARRPSISVVIPTMNRAEVLLDTLRDIAAQDFPDFEVIVVDQSDTLNEAARALLADFGKPAQYHYIMHFRGLPEARNYGWRQATGDIIVYTDDDIRCGPEFLQAHLDAHVTSGAAMVAGGITEQKGDVLQPGKTGFFSPWTATPIGNFHLRNPGWCQFGKGANFSVTRSILEKVNGFDEQFSIGAALYEEGELGLRLHANGFRCWFAPEAHLTHLAAPAGGCRVLRDPEKYIYGLAHNRSILIRRYFRGIRRLTSVMRLFVLIASHAWADKSWMVLASGVRGCRVGWRHRAVVFEGSAENEARSYKK